MNPRFAQRLTTMPTYRVLVSRNRDQRAQYGMRPSQLTPDAVPIDGLLSELGYSSPAAREQALLALRQAGLTTGRKQNISVEKLPLIRSILAERFVLTCGAAPCQAAPAASQRQPLRVLAAYCEACHGNSTTQAIEAMLHQLDSAGVTRVVIVGGSPDARALLRRFFAESPVQFDLIDGTRATTAQRARALCDAADVILLWANTMLAHSVSDQFKATDYRAKTVTIARRGIEALATGVMEHLRLREGGEHARS